MMVDTHNYRMSHGRGPMPSQRGLWMFTVVRRDGASTTISASGTYTEALRAAKAEARTIGGAETIHVCP